jgi:hypothetical protein
LVRDTRPSVAAVSALRQRRTQKAVNSADPIDREVLVLPHFEDLFCPSRAVPANLRPATSAADRPIREIR